MYFTDTFFFPLLLLFPAQPPFLRTGICRMSYSVVFIRNIVRILYLPGCLVRNKAILVMHLQVFSRGSISPRETPRIDVKNAYPL